MTYTHADYVVVGAGIVGLCMARALRLSDPKASIVVLEKEAHIGLHASGRNSGVIHAGLYYPEGTLKATLCVSGADQMRTYCQTEGLPYRPCGKLLLPTAPHDIATLERIYHRALTNGVEVSWVPPESVPDYEPHLKLNAYPAVFSPNTAVISPKAVLNQLAQWLEDHHVQIILESEVVRIDDIQGDVTTTNHHIYYGHLINAAGAYADRLAHQCDVGLQYTMLPFKGMYYELAPTSKLKFQHLIYPVPDLSVPFLGIHVTLTPGQTVYFGPTAIPAFGREHYTGLTGVDWEALPDQLKLMAGQYLRNIQGFRKLANQEAWRFMKPAFVQAAQDLIPELSPKDLLPSHKVGIRAQLFDRQENLLVMDFLVRHGIRSTHILNAVSPAFTCGFSTADFVVQSLMASAPNQANPAEVPSGSAPSATPFGSSTH